MTNKTPLNNLSIDLEDCLCQASNLIAYTRAEESAARLAELPPLENKELLVALSGGSDSTALLLALSKTAPNFGFRLKACHVNHALRGEESDKDAEFCRSLCQELNIECTVVKLKMSNLSLNTKGHFSEAILREKRYECLTNLAHQNRISFILTAHTLDDQIETLLFRLFRGTSVSGLRGIELCRKLTSDIYLLRPLLKLSKAQCQEYLKQQSIEPREDSSNFNEIYSRNYIRHKIIPAINTRFPDFGTHLDSLRDIISNEDALLDQMSSQLLTQLQSSNRHIWTIELFEAQPLALQRRIIVLALKERSIEVSFKLLEEIAKLIKQNCPPFSSFNLSKNWRIRRADNKLFWQEIRQAAKPSIKFAPIEVTIPSINLLTALNMTLSVEPYYTKASPTLPFDKSLLGKAKNNAILADLSRVKPPLMIRQRLPGDKISPLGMSQTVKLKKYIHTHKVSLKSALSTSCLALLADQEEVLWVPGIGMSEKIKVIDMPSHILQWRQSNVTD